MSLLPRPAPPAKATQFAKSFSAAPPFLLGPAHWHEALSPQYRQFIDQLAEVMEQCAIAWDAQIGSHQSPDLGMTVDVTEQMVLSMREITDVTLSDTEFLYFDEP